MRKYMANNSFKALVEQTNRNKKQALIQALKGKVTVDNWEEVVTHIMECQKGVTQFQLLAQCLATMNIINFEVMEALCSRFHPYFSHSLSVPTTLILIKYILNYEFRGAETLVEREYRNAVEIYGLFTKELTHMGSTGLQQPNVEQIRQIQTCMQIVPTLYKKCPRLILSPQHLESMLMWICVVSTDSYDGTIKTGKFCEFLAGKATGQGTREESRVQPTSEFLSSIMECSRLKLSNRCNLAFLMDYILPARLLSSCIQKLVALKNMSVSVFIQFWQLILSVGASPMTVKFIYQVCTVLKVHDRIQALTQVYRTIVVGIIFHKYKFSRTAQQGIQVLALFFVGGMFPNLPYSQETIAAIHEDFDRLDIWMKPFWSDILAKVKPTSIPNTQTVQRQTPFRPSRQSNLWKQKLIKSVKSFSRGPQAFTLVECALNILFTSGNLRKALKEHCLATKYVLQELYRHVHSVFSMMDKGKPDLVGHLVAKIYSLAPNPEKHLSVTHWLKFILRTIGQEFFLHNQKLFFLYERMFRVKISTSYTCIKCGYQNAQMIEQYSVTLDYGDKFGSKVNLHDKCKQCPNVSSNGGSMVHVPDTIVVSYNPPTQKNPERFPIPRALNDHRLTHVQFCKASGSESNMHIFWRSMQHLCDWFHFDGENLKQMQMTSPDEPFQQELGPEYVVQTLIYQQVLK